MAARWSVLIGVNGYHESLGALAHCASDVELVQETLTSEPCGFPEENIVVLSDDQPKDRLPTFGNIHSWLGTWLSRPAAEDLVLVYFAGHGREAKGRGLLAPVDATLESLPVTGIPIDYVRDLLEGCRAAQKVLILDACHSGAGRDVATMGAMFRQALNAGEGLYTIASCDVDQISYDWPEKKHGVFTHYFTEALRYGAPVEPDGRVLLDGVYEWTRNAVLSWTADKRLKQDPVRICRVKGDFPIASRALSLEQQLEMANAKVKAREDTIAELRGALDRLTKESSNLADQLRELQHTNESPDTPFKPKEVAKTGFFGGTRAYDGQLNDISDLVARRCRSGTLEISLELDEWKQESHYNVERIHGALVRAFVLRGFRAVPGGEACLNFSQYELGPHGPAKILARVTKRTSGEVLWAGQIAIPQEEVQQ